MHALQSAKILLRGAEACLAALPTHRSVECDISAMWLVVEVWTRPRVRVAPTEAAFVPRMIVVQQAQEAQALIDSMGSALFLE